MGGRDGGATAICPGCPEVESRIPVPVASVVQSDIVGPREAGSGCNQDVPPGIMPSLIARLLRAAQEDNPAEVKVPPNTGGTGCGDARTESVSR